MLSEIRDRGVNHRHTNHRVLEPEARWHTFNSLYKASLLDFVFSVASA